MRYHWVLAMVPKTSSMVFLQYLTTVFDNIQDGVLLIAVEPHNTFRLLMANRGFGRNTGHGMGVIGKTIEEIVASPETYHKLLPRYLEAIKAKKPVEFTDTYDEPRGVQVYEMQILPVTSAVGEVVQLAVIARNVTELHQLRHQIREAGESLEQVAYNLRNAQQL
jgi:hypothetical protein